MKWKLASAKYRKDIARAVIAASPALLSEADGRPNNADIRRALLRYGFNTKQRVYPPDDVAEILAWATRNSIPMSALAEPAVARRILDQASGRLDGKSAAASTARRNRTILANAMDYAIELGLIDSNPIRALKWTAPKVSSQVDRRSVVNPRQARALLAAAREQQPSGPTLVAFLRGHVLRGAAPRGSDQPSRGERCPTAQAPGAHAGCRCACCRRRRAHGGFGGRSMRRSRGRAAGGRGRRPDGARRRGETRSSRGGRDVHAGGRRLHRRAARHEADQASRAARDRQQSPETTHLSHGARWQCRRP
jgi:hypothetical protein